MYLAIVVVATFVAASGLDITKLTTRPRSPRGFSLHRYLGKWYLQARLKPCSWSGSDQFQEWTHTLTKHGDQLMATEYWFNDVCVKTSAIVTKQRRSQGYFTAKDSFGDVWSGDYVVVATDYKTYAICWGCTKPSVYRTKCDDTYITVKTRSPLPKPRTWKIIASKLKKQFDISLTEMRRIRHTKSGCSFYD